MKLLSIRSFYILIGLYTALSIWLLSGIDSGPAVFYSTSESMEIENLYECAFILFHASIAALGFAYLKDKLVRNQEEG